MKEPSSPTGNPQSSLLSPHCEECGNNPWKYRCPGCSIRTCSLPCVKAHKRRTACTGQKDRSVVVPISHFDDNVLLSDYSFLEDAKRATEAARRGRNGIGGNYRFMHPPPLRQLRMAAKKRQTRLLVLPYGMSKRVNNRTRFDKRSDSIFWTIEWRFHSTNVVLMDHGVNESMNIWSIIKKHLNPGPWNHQLKSFCNEDAENLKFFLKKNAKDSKLLFRELNSRIPIVEQMADVIVVEYPVIFVYLPSHSYNFEVEKCAEPFPTDIKSSGKPEIIASPKGIVFREEELEDDDTSETQVLDLMHRMETRASSGFQNPKEVACSDKKYISQEDETSETRVLEPMHHMETEAPSDFRNPEQVALSGKASISDAGISAFTSSYFISNNKRRDLQDRVEEKFSPANDNATVPVDCDFDIEHDMKDAYSELIGEINVDDYLCLDGFYSEGETRDQKVAWLGNAGDPQEVELEEGEIPPT